ncbi:hypothetical protein M9H77_22442 [Catharanthus roseus]|uniref:Uncharacterized protein n=1 Tax=Catharanthus roseus TaxID=4058 RepID=A0ACC0ASL5_CATRO|nr:hypothetical protein M9H77_22442 [Catharanthus roseus]
MTHSIVDDKDTLPSPVALDFVGCLAKDTYRYLYCVFGVLRCLLPQGFNHQYRKEPKLLNAWLKLQILNRGNSNQEADLGRDLDPILQAQKASYQSVSKIFESHGRSVPSYATNATILERIGTTTLMPSKGCERLKKRRGSHL